MDENKKPEEQISATPEELAQAELEQASGGVAVNGGSGAVSITKHDCASPKLY